MKPKPGTVQPIRPLDETPYTRHQAGTLTRIDPDGRPWVTFPGSNEVEVLGRFAVDPAQLSRIDRTSTDTRSVLLVFEDGDPHRPLIVSFVSDRLPPARAPEVSPEAPSPTRELRVDGKRLVVAAEDEIELRCGKSSIVMRKDGKILIKGTDLVSRSSGPNRIRGGNISLN